MTDPNREREVAACFLLTILILLALVA